MHDNKSELNGLLEILYQEKLLSLEIAMQVNTNASKNNLPVISYLVTNHILPSETILNCCVRIFNLPTFDLKNYDLSWLQNPIINLKIICRYRIIPLHHDQKNLQLGLSDPTDHNALSTIRFLTNLMIQPVLILESALDQFLKQYCQTNIYSQLENTLAKIKKVEDQTSELIIQHDKEDEPLIKFVNKLLNDAIEKNISDIHIEPQTNHCRIRFRKDGLLYEVATLPLHLSDRLIMRLKIMANLNIAEKRLPQDGHIPMQLQNKIDFRMSTCPSIHGEKIVLRLLNNLNFNFAISALGLLPEQELLFLEKITQPQGLILVTGPTGSGKTLTLYSALHFLNQVEKNITTIEDPVEIELPGITQININSHIGWDFSHVLRSLLRQDPDMIMIGEIRDTQTAAIAMQAAQTGHLVLASLHANSAVETLNRLQALGVNSYQISNCLSLIIAQRLVRKLCVTCKQLTSVKINNELFDCFSERGCSDCHNGYLGRTGIFECLHMTDNLANLITKNHSNFQILEYLKTNNWTFLSYAGLQKVKNGTTSYAELSRVLGKIN